ncbi:MAG: DNA repair protein RadC [Candidatus Latescibacteria bacterium]|nr:DNA repair protein RadC [Candidatus Latescibacterota bacterium]
MSRCGAEALRTPELLSLLLDGKQETASRLLETTPLEEMAGMSLEQWKGRLTRKQASRLVAAFELARRGLQRGLGLLPTISCPAEAVPLLGEIKDQRKEHFLCLYLNARNQVVHKEVISIGSLSASIVHPREVFRVALHHAVASVILTHNHPSGDVSPSQDDLELTRRLVKAGQLMGIEVLDHLIIGPQDFLSLKERGLM